MKSAKGKMQNEEKQEPRGLGAFGSSFCTLPFAFCTLHSLTKRLAPALLIVLAAAGLAAAREKDPLAEASAAANQRQYVDAIAKAMSVASSKEETAERRGKAFDLAATCYLEIACPRLAIATCHQALVALGRDDPNAVGGWSRIAQIHIGRLEYAEAIAHLERAMTELDLAKLPGEHRGKILSLLASCREQVGQTRGALSTYETLLALAGEKDDVGEAAARAARLYIETQQFDKARACLERLYGKLDGGDTVVSTASKAYLEFAQKLAALGRADEADAMERKIVAVFARREPFAARTAFLQLLEGKDDAAALKLVAELKDDEARVLASDEVLAALIPAALRLGRTGDLALACTRALLAEPFDETLAYSCSKALMDIRVREGRLDDAVAAAGANYAAAGFAAYVSASSFGRAVDLVGEALRARDGHLVSGNAFRAYQLYGPAGPDRKAGTADDLANPFDALTLKPDPEIDRLFEAAIAAQPISVAGHRARGWFCLLWSKPKKALAEFKREFALCSLETTELSRAAQDVALGLKALHGTPVGMEVFADFQRYGPNGPDGRAGTPDDLKDPLAGL